jgi:hypothetical protein
MDQHIPNETKDKNVLDDQDGFLLREGLQMLADYRSIKDPEMRSRVRDMISTLAGRTL